MVKTKKKTTSLIAFTHQNCANYDTHYSYCFGLDCYSLSTDGKKVQPLQENEKCLIQQGKRCGYFERVLLPIAKQLGIYEKIIKQYGKTGNLVPKETTRSCPDCGAELEYRKKLCPKCREKRKQKANRENQKNYRENNRT